MDQTIGIQKFVELFGCSNTFKEPDVTGFSDSFKPVNPANPKYEPPFFKIICGDTNIPQLILVTAAGAVGKSELTKYLSSNLQIPVLDLAKHPPVGDSTLTGVISKTYDSKRKVSQSLTSGEYGIIIDAVDEGALKVRHDAFTSFLDDVALWINKEQKTVSICMMGRTNIMEETALYLIDRGVRLLLVQIEPFTIEQAKNFLYKQVVGNQKKKYNKAYKETVDYIVTSIGGFFKNQGESGQSSYRNFIGYAPVLLAISKLLNSEPNYTALLNRLKEINSEKVKLLISLTEDIIQRENKKILTNLEDSLFKEFDEQTVSKAKSCCYNEEEQLVRILTKVLKLKISFTPTKTAAFDEQYENVVKDFLAEHPFLSNNKILNVVFESYLIAKLASYGEKYAEVLNTYLKDFFKNSFAFYPIVTTIFELIEQPLPQYLFGYVYCSLLNQSVQASNTQLEIFQGDDGENSAHIFLENEEEKFEYDFDLALGKEHTLDLGLQLSNASICGNFDIILLGSRVTFTGPISIVCKTLWSQCCELILYKVSDNIESSISINCESIQQFVTDNGCTRIIDNGNLSIYCNDSPDFPFRQFYKGIRQFQEETDWQKYQKLINILVQFRGHKKDGDWGKKKDKIDRRFERGVGFKVKEALISKGIIYPDRHLYKLNQEKMQETLNLSYSDMMLGKTNKKVEEFIRNI